MANNQTVNAVQASGPRCNHCWDNESIFAKTVEEGNYMQNYQRQQSNPHSKTYNPGWRNHLNLS